ncbi:uncharacterized protein MELLADRAFT_64560 [Melampsora larici-populina 98AG31]|uniref:Uncharacterized protein n=1 Tax=Melampsora larici-populina (strain 98AG31 / pathotype 3-4-7) TaxID=747676 RepID=F4RRW6_MELLP|nr:uncharacterized protein MELLADRAFT_64560 [Melampsora larici-populina 98AG31]EGG04879.1 hypothetical protein MELLADRAFT_64560 [Melampsora larici-populina 98AG31]
MPKTKMKKRIQQEDRSSSLPPALEHQKSKKSVHRKQHTQTHSSAPSASSSRPRKNSNLPSNNRSNTTNLSTLAHSQPTNNSLALAHSQPTNATSFSQPHVLTNSQKAYLKHVTETLDLSSKAHEKALKDVVRRDFNALIMDVKIQAYSCIRDSKRSAIRQCFDALCKKYIKSRDKQFIKAHYPTGYETPDGAEAVKTITDWANRCATDTRSRLRHCLLIDVKPSGNEASMNAMPSLQQLTSLVHHTFILQIDPRTEEQIFKDVSKDFKHRLAFLRIHAVYTMQNPSTDRKYCIWTSVDNTLEQLKIMKKKHGKLYKTAHQDEVEEEDNARPAAEDDLSDRLGDEDDFLPDDEDDFLPDDEDDGLPDNEDDGLPDDEDDGLPDNEDDGSLDDEDDGSLEI